MDDIVAANVHARALFSCDGRSRNLL
jgi:hypothetical protein